MKKNFVKKLALGLAFSVAVSSIPAINIAAAEKCSHEGTCPSFKSSSTKEERKELEVGQTKKYATKDNNRWYLKRFNVGNDEIAEAKMSKKGKFIKITGVKAGTTSVRLVFKHGKTKDVCKSAVIHIKVNDKEEETKAIALESVQATGVKKLVVNFNQTVDTTKATIKVKKGTVSPSVDTIVWAEDGKSATINMGSKLTKGTYDVTVTGLTEAELTGNVTVEDETLTSIEFVGTNLVADATTASQASIEFKTLNQYGEKMNVSGVTANSSFSATPGTVTACTAKQNGVVTITGINTLFQIPGTTGTITLVDTTKGVTATATVAYSAPATAKTMTVVGLYNKNNGVMSDITKGEFVTDYSVLVQVQDQYGNNVGSRFLRNIASDIAVTPIAGGNVTGVGAVSTWTDETVDGVDYIAIPLVGGTAATGTFYLTFVNQKAGLLANASFTVNSGTVIKTLNIYANDTIYENQVNELGFEAIDANGNSVTKYSDLKNIVFTVQNRDADATEDQVYFEKQADGSAKLYFKPELTLTTAAPNNKQSTIASFTVAVNEVTTANYFVKPVSFGVSQARVATEVVGIKADAATAVASGSSLTLDLNNILVEDQYANVMSVASLGSTVKVSVPATLPSGDANGSVTTVDSDFSNSTNTVTFNASASAAGDVTTVWLNIGTIDATGADNYELKLYTVDSYKASNLSIKTVNNGNTVKAATGVALAWNGNPKDLTESDVKVYGVVGGRNVEIPNTQYKITGNTGYALDYTKNPVATETGKMEVTVDTVNGPVVLTKEYTFSNAAPTLTTLKDNGGVTLSVTDTTLDKAELAGAFTMKDQYGNAIGDTGVKYTIIDVTGSGELTRTTSHNATNDVVVSNVTAGNRFTITATKGDLTVTKTVTITNP